MKINTNFFVKGAFLNNKLYWTERDDGYLCYYDFENDSTMYEIDFKPIEFSAVVDSKEDFLLGVSQSGRWFWKYNINTNDIYGISESKKEILEEFNNVSHEDVVEKKEAFYDKKK